jgi:SAM-dependent methyltransferase
LTARARTWSPSRVCAARPDQACELVGLGGFADRSGRVGQVSVERCRHCGLAVTRPPLQDVAFLYEDRTSIDFQPSTTGLSRLIKTTAFSAQARRMLAQAGFSGGRIVDFACGSGLFTHCLANVAQGAEVIGVDFHGQPPPDLGHTPYRAQSNLDDLVGTADLVLAMHVVEHDDDPQALVGRIAALAKPGGTLIVETPNVDCFWVGVFGKHWDAWYVPYHRVHFSRPALRALVEACGLQIMAEHDVAVPTMGRSIANTLGLRNSTPFILMSAGLQPVQWVMETLTRRPAALRLVLRKPG